MTASSPELRQAILTSADLLVRSGVLSHSNHGNSSVRLPDGQSMLITGVSSLFGQTPDSLAVLDLEEAAEVMLLAERLGGSKPFPPGALEQVRDRMRAFA